MVFFFFFFFCLFFCLFLVACDRRGDEVAWLPMFLVVVVPVCCSCLSERWWGRARLPAAGGCLPKCGDPGGPAGQAGNRPKPSRPSRLIDGRTLNPRALSLHSSPTARGSSLFLDSDLRVFISDLFKPNLAFLVCYQVHSGSRLLVLNPRPPHTSLPPP